MAGLDDLIPSDHPAIVPQQASTTAPTSSLDSLIPDDHPAIQPASAVTPVQTQTNTLLSPPSPVQDYVPPANPEGHGTSRFGGLGQGIRDIGNGVIQKVAANAPDSVVQWLGHNYPHDIGPSETSDYHYKPEDIMTMVRNQGAEYENDKKNSARKDSWDLPRLGGNILAVPGLGELGPVIGGTVGGALQPNYNAKNSEDVNEGTLESGAAGGATGYGLNKVVKFLSPNINTALKYFTDRGVFPTLGQISQMSNTTLGKLPAWIEEGYSKLPFIGNFVNSARGASVADVNKMAYNDALAPINRTTDAKPGLEGLQEVASKIDDAYDAAKKRLTFKGDDEFRDNVADINARLYGDVSHLEKADGSIVPNPDAGMGAFDKPLRDLYHRVTGSFNTATSDANTMDGANLVRAQSVLKANIQRLGKGNANEQALGDLLTEYNKNINDALTRTNSSSDLQALNNAHKSYALYQRLVDASASGKNNGFVFTPNQYMSSIAKWSGKQALAQGDAINQQFATSASDMFKNTIRDSGTTSGVEFGRLLKSIATKAATGTGTTAVGLTHPLIGAPIFGAPLLTHNGFSRKWIAKTLAGDRPVGSEQMSELLKTVAPYVSGPTGNATIGNDTPSTDQQMQSLMANQAHAKGGYIQKFADGGTPATIDNQTQALFGGDPNYANPVSPDLIQARQWLNQNPDMGTGLLAKQASLNDNDTAPEGSVDSYGEKIKRGLAAAGNMGLEGVNSLAKGAVDLAAGTQTGNLTPEALSVIVGSGLGAGKAFHPADIGGSTQLGIFGGVSARTADLQALQKAKDMQFSSLSNAELAQKYALQDKYKDWIAGNKEMTPDEAMQHYVLSTKDAPVSMEDIWHQTGWFKDADGHWKFEIPDTHSSLSDSIGRNRYNPDLLTFDNHKLSDILDHKDLFDAYPQLQDTPVGSTGFNIGINGAVTSDGKILLKGGRPEEVHSTLLHELQHKVQGEEGFNTGGNTAEFLPPGFSENHKLASDNLNASRKAVENLGGEPFKLEYAMDRLAMFKNDPKLADSTYGKMSIKNYTDTVNDFTKKEGGAQALSNLVNTKNKIQPLWNLKDTAYQKYANLGGEAEARNVQTRFKSGDTWAPPWLTSDVPPTERMIRTSHDQTLVPGRDYGYADVHDPKAPYVIFDTTKKYGANIAKFATEDEAKKYVDDKPHLDYTKTGGQ